jgi:hypothetical protein
MEDKKMKHTRLFSLIAAVSLVSCMEEIAVENEMMDGTQQTPDAECPVYTDSITLVAFSGETKTQREDTEITWTEGDRIKVYFDGGSAESLPAVISGEGTTASFTIPLEEPLTEDAKIYAVYPSTASASLEEGTFKVTIPAEQSAVFKNADILAATTTAGAASLHFQHVAGLVSFTVSEGNPKGIQTAVFKDFFRSAGIAGTCPLTFDEEGNMTASNGEFTGTIDSESGMIGGWKIGKTTLEGTINGEPSGIILDAKNAAICGGKLKPLGTERMKLCGSLEICDANGNSVTTKGINHIGRVESGLSVNGVVSTAPGIGLSVDGYATLKVTEDNIGL